MAAPVGNKFAAKAKIVTDAIRKAIVQEDGKRLRQGVDKLMEAFAAGEPWALQFVTDRLDGKAHQTSEITVNDNRDARDYTTAELLQAIAAERASGEKASAGVTH